MHLKCKGKWRFLCLTDFYQLQLLEEHENKMGHNVLPKIVRYEASEIATNNELEYQGKWKGYEDMLQIVVEVSRCK